MKSLEAIERNLQKATTAHQDGDALSREDYLRAAFAHLEVERLKFYFNGEYNLGSLGNELMQAIKLRELHLFLWE